MEYEILTIIFIIQAFSSPMGLTTGKIQ